MNADRILKPLPDPLSWATALAGTTIPVLRTTAAALAAFAERQEDASAHKVAEVVMADPLMTARLFAYVSGRSSRGRAPVIGSVTAAIVMMGVPPFFANFASLPTVADHLRDDHVAQQGLLKVVRRALRATHYARDWAVLRHDVEAETIMMATLLHDLPEMLLWCAAPAMAGEIAARLAASPGLRSVHAQKAVLGVTSDEVRRALITVLRLPAFLSEVAEPRGHRSSQVRTVDLAIRLSRHSAVSWDNPALPDDYAAIAELLGLSPQRVAEMVKPHPKPSHPPG